MSRVCTSLHSTKMPHSLLINDKCTQYKMKNAAECMLEDPQPKQCFVCAKFRKGKTLCSLLVFVAGQFVP